MSSFLWPRPRAVDSTGAPISGAKLNFYEAGTATPLDTYSDQTLATPNANPVVADANGIFGQIYLKTTQEYKVVYTDASDVTIWTVDNVDAVQITGVDIDTRLKQIASNPLDYRSAVGDGVADEYLAVQDAIDNATRVVDLLGKTFRCDSAITITAGLTFQNGNLDFTNCTDAEYIKIQGSVGSYTNLTGNALYLADKVAATSVSGLAAGNTVNLISSGTYCASGQEGELAQIRSISTLDVYLGGEIMDGYTTANTARLAKVTTVDNVVLKNLVITTNNAVATANTRVISCHATKALRMHNVTINGIADYGVLLAGCLDTLIEGCEFTNGSNSAAGILLEEATQDCIISGNTFRRLATPVDANTTLSLSTVPLGIRRRIDIVNNTFESATSDSPLAIHIGQDCQYVRIDDNDFQGAHSSAEIDIDCVDVGFTNNRLFSGGGAGINAACLAPNKSDRGYRVNISGNSIRYGGGDITFSSGAVAGGAGPIYELKISDNVSDFGQISVTGAATGANITSALISGNTVLNMSLVGTNITVTDMTVADNRIGAAVAKLLVITDIDNVKVSGNKLTGDDSTCTHGIDYTAASGNLTASFADNVIRGTTDYGILVDDSAGSSVVVDIDGCKLWNEDAGGIAGIKLVEVVDWSVAGCRIVSNGRGLWTANNSNAYTQAAVCGNRIEVAAGDGSAATPLVIAGTANTSDQLTITGNNLYNTDGGASTYVLQLSGYHQHVNITGNNFARANDSDDNISLAGTAGSAIARCRIVGNSLFNGAYGINASNCTTTVQQMNNIANMATGQVNGTISGTISATGQASSNENGIAGTGDGTGHGAVLTGGATGAALALVAQARPTGAQGDVYVDSTDGVAYVYDGSAWKPASPIRYIGTNDADTLSADGTFAQTYDIPANLLAVGSIIKWRVATVVTVTDTAGGTETVQLMADAVQIAAAGAYLVSGAASFAIFDITGVVKAIGGSGKIVWCGHVTDTKAAGETLASSTDEKTIDTTQAITLDCRLNNIANSPTVKLRQFTVEIDGPLTA